MGLCDEYIELDSDGTLKNEMVILLFGEGQVVCLAMSQLFPLITRRDLQAIEISGKVSVLLSPFKSLVG